VAGQLRRSAPSRFFAQATRQVQGRAREENAALRRVWSRPRDADAHLAAARLRRRAGDLTKAEAHLKQALEIRPGWPEARQELDRITRALGAL
jgi:tetratricopeptide (TPR) repeat protein